MSDPTVPKPAVSLRDICSVIYGNTLYTYSADAFQSIELEVGAKWNTLSQGIPVTGAACVGSTPVAPREPGFFVVGGKGPEGYKGLQKFTYSTGKWESLSPVSNDVTNRVWHGAAYINSTDTIMVYAGTQDGVKHSSTQTFTIGASAPFDVSSFDSAGTPPSTSPLLLPWSTNQAVLVGGESNTKVMIFSPETGWKDSGASLATPMPNDVSTMRSTVLAGDDGSKVLYTFDTSSSPTKVTRTVLINGQGQPVQNSATIEKRLTSDQWPAYNSTFAPKTTRDDYSLSQDANGRIVMAGGNDQQPLGFFDGRENKWMDAASVFNEAESFRTQDVDSTSSISTSSATATPTRSPSPSATSSIATTSASPQPTSVAGSITSTPAPDASSNPPVNTILGAVLGTTALVLLLLGVLYCLLRRKKKRDELESGNARQAGALPPSEKGGLTYAADFPNGPTPGAFRGHQQQDSQASFSSMAILMGKVNQQKSGTQPQTSKESKHSSTSSILNTAFKKSISHPIPQPQSPNPFSDPTPVPIPELRDEKGGTVVFSNDLGEPRPRPSRPDGPDSTRRSSGWNRYWSGGSTLNILGFGSGASKRTTVDSDISNYSTNNRITQDSATVPALNPGRLPMQEPKPEFSRVNTGSPTISSSPHLNPGMTGRIERPLSTSSEISGYSSGIPASVHEAWDPTSAGKPWGANRAESNYTSTYNSVYSTPLAPPTAASTNTLGKPSSGNAQPQLAMASMNSDMSWLNLSDDTGPRR